MTIELHSPTVASHHLPMRKPFDVPIEGLDLKNSRGDKTAVELFLAGVRGWNAATLVVQNFNMPLVPPPPLSKKWSPLH